jgi:hypothetical protein
MSKTNTATTGPQVSEALCRRAQTLFDSHNIWKVLIGFSAKCGVATKKDCEFLLSAYLSNLQLILLTDYDHLHRDLKFLLQLADQVGSNLGMASLALHGFEPAVPMAFVDLLLEVDDIGTFAAILRSLGLGDALDRLTVEETAELETTFIKEAKARAVKEYATLGRDVMPKVLAAELKASIK